MKTKIFKDYKEFTKRKNKAVNGVTRGFADKHPDYEEDNEGNIGCFNCYDCFVCNYCNHCSHCNNCHRLNHRNDLSNECDW